MDIPNPLYNPLNPSVPMIFLNTSIPFEYLHVDALGIEPPPQPPPP
uniref:Uncharacterized protein n=1 Tax=Rhizophora mucronata TaxID=61149 RepID=A0A2P2N3W6_RHIMU